MHSNKRPKVQPPTIPPLLTKRQAAQYLSVSIGTVERLMRAGALPYVRVGMLARFEISALANFVEANTRGGAAA